MQTVCAGLLAVTAALVATGAVSDSPPAGATSCTGCHGAEMLSLDALSADEIARAMEEFRSGAREATLMNRIAAGFTAEESVAIATWLAGD
jgi:cytochrome c553